LRHACSTWMISTTCWRFILTESNQQRSQCPVFWAITQFETTIATLVSPINVHLAPTVSNEQMISQGSWIIWMMLEEKLDTLVELFVRNSEMILWSKFFLDSMSEVTDATWTLEDFTMFTSIVVEFCSMRWGWVYRILLEFNRQWRLFPTRLSILLWLLTQSCITVDCVRDRNQKHGRECMVSWRLTRWVTFLLNWLLDSTRNFIPTSKNLKQKHPFIVNLISTSSHPFRNSQNGQRETIASFKLPSLPGKRISLLLQERFVKSIGILLRMISMQRVQKLMFVNFECISLEWFPSLVWFHMTIHRFAWDIIC